MSGLECVERHSTSGLSDYDRFSLYNCRAELSHLIFHQSGSMWYHITQPHSKFHRAIITFRVMSSRLVWFDGKWSSTSHCLIRLVILTGLHTSGMWPLQWTNRRLAARIHHSFPLSMLIPFLGTLSTNRNPVIESSISRNRKDFIENGCKGNSDLAHWSVLCNSLPHYHGIRVHNR